MYHFVPLAFCPGHNFDTSLLQYGKNSPTCILVAATSNPPTGWRRPRGGPRETWLRTVSRDVQPFNISIHSAWHHAADRQQWHELDWIEQSLTPTRHSIDHFGGGLHSQSLDCYWHKLMDTAMLQQEYNIKEKYALNGQALLRTPLGQLLQTPSRLRRETSLPYAMTMSQFSAILVPRLSTLCVDTALVLIIRTRRL